MKLSLIALIFLALVAVAVVSFMAGRGSRRPPAALTGHSRPEPVRQVLAGGGSGLEILVLRRPIESGSAEFLDASLATSVGVRDPQAWDFLELLLVNRGEQSIPVAASGLTLRGPEGKEVGARRLRDLPEADIVPATRAPFLSVFSSAESDLLGGFERREVVAVPAGTEFSEWTGAAFGDIELSPARIDARSFRAWLLGENRQGSLLSAVLVRGG
ncbi:MAG TPA: hypothetical protein PKA37_14660 [Planctomycetota bacterium]|nr:hypothetical protein [Planctomycetota bacterium]